MEVAPQFGIRKRVVHFRDAKDVREGELDSVVLHAGKWDRPLTEYGRSKKQPKKQG
jgi:hypothetical protein